MKQQPACAARNGLRLLIQIGGHAGFGRRIGDVEFGDEAGHIIRLEVSSSNFPRFDRNLNTGADQATSREFVSAINTILHDPEHPSALLVPVIPAGAPAP